MNFSAVDYLASINSCNSCNSWLISQFFPSLNCKRSKCGECFLTFFLRFRNLYVSLWRFPAFRGDESGMALLIINEALCSSCTLEPRKFQVQQENMMASACMRGMLSASSVQGFPRTSEWRSGFCSTLHASNNRSLWDRRSKVLQKE